VSGRNLTDVVHIPLWRILPGPAPVLSAGEVHVWSGSLDSLSNSEGLRGLLSSAEVRRSDLQSSAKSRARFVASHGLLRKILGLYTGTDPRSLRLDPGPHGKPQLSGPERRIRFSVSSSGPHFACALARRREVGVDIEEILGFAGMDSFVDRYFSEYERHEYRRVGGSARVRFFYEVWTAKEAYLKGTGRGLIDGAARVSTLGESPGWKALVQSGSKWTEEPWTIRRFESTSGLMGSIAVSLAST